jgi:hypothetical protein
MDNKYFNPSNVRYCYDKGPLRRSIERFVQFPIATSFDKREPRLLLVSVDVATGVAVTFDSYEKEDGSRRSVYGNYLVSVDGREEYEYDVEYNGDQCTACDSLSFPS